MFIPQIGFVVGGRGGYTLRQILMRNLYLCVWSYCNETPLWQMAIEHAKCIWVTSGGVSCTNSCFHSYHWPQNHTIDEFVSYNSSWNIFERTFFLHSNSSTLKLTITLSSQGRWNICPDCSISYTEKNRYWKLILWMIRMKGYRLKIKPFSGPLAWYWR